MRVLTNPSSHRRPAMPATPAPRVHDLRAQCETVLEGVLSAEAQTMTADTMERRLLGQLLAVGGCLFAPVVGRGLLLVRAVPDHASGGDGSGGRAGRGGVLCAAGAAPCDGRGRHSGRAGGRHRGPDPAPARHGGPGPPGQGPEARRQERSHADRDLHHRPGHTHARGGRGELVRCGGGGGAGARRPARAHGATGPRGHGASACGRRWPAKMPR